jgi:hypothetical protein
MVGWLVGWLFGWLVCWLVDWLIGWLISWLISWLVGWLFSMFVFQFPAITVCHFTVISNTNLSLTLKAFNAQNTP